MGSDLHATNKKDKRQSKMEVHLPLLEAEWPSG